MSRILTDTVEAAEAMGNIFEIVITIVAVFVLSVVGIIRLSK